MLAHPHCARLLLSRPPLHAPKRSGNPSPSPPHPFLQRTLRSARQVRPCALPAPVLLKRKMLHIQNFSRIPYRTARAPSHRHPCLRPSPARRRAPAKGTLRGELFRSASATNSSVSAPRPFTRVSAVCTPRSLTSATTGWASRAASSPPLALQILPMNTRMWCSMARVRAWFGIAERGNLGPTRSPAGFTFTRSWPRASTASPFSLAAASTIP